MPRPGWAFAGAPVGLDPAGVWDLVTDTKAADYPETATRASSSTCSTRPTPACSAASHRAFNGDPESSRWR